MMVTRAVILSSFHSVVFVFFLKNIIAKIHYPSDSLHLLLFFAILYSLFILDNLALRRAVPLLLYLDILSAKAISSNALDPLLFYDKRDYQSLWTLDFCEHNVGRQTQPAWDEGKKRKIIMKINGTWFLHFYHAQCSFFFGSFKQHSSLFAQHCWWW